MSLIIFIKLAHILSIITNQSCHYILHVGISKLLKRKLGKFGRKKHITRENICFSLGKQGVKNSILGIQSMQGWKIFWTKLNNKS